MSFGSFEDSPLARELADLTKRRKRVADVTAPLPRTTRVITVSNQKGGVGKTTTAVNVAAAMAKLGARVLVIDLDPQGNASTALGVQHHADVPSVYDVLIDDFPLTEVIQQSPEFDTLFCAPSTIHLAGAEIELVSQVAREHRLRTAVEDLQRTVEQPYHYIFIDCPPSLGLLTVNAMVAAQEVLIPIQCEYYALEGLSQLLRNIELVQAHLNRSLVVSTILLTMYDGRTKLADQVTNEVRHHFGETVLKTVIPRSVKVSEAPGYGQTVLAYDPGSRGSLSYLDAAREVAERGAETP
jgi:chromosome partitioning protein